MRTHAHTAHTVEELHTSASRPRRLPLLLCALILLQLAAGAVAQGELAPNTARAQAVSLCREGRTEQGLNWLRALHEADLYDQATLADYVLELHRAGRNADVARLAPRLDLEAASDELIRAVSGSLDKLQRHDEAAAVLGLIEQRKWRDQERERASVMARNGRYEESLTVLRTLHEAAPKDARVLDDYVVVLSWAGEDAEAARLAALVDRTRAPDYVLEAIGRALRNERRYAEAAQVLRVAAERTPVRWQARLGLAYALAESGENDEARAELALVAAAQPFNEDALFGRATIHRWIGEPFEALAALDELRRLNPDHAAAQRLRVHTLADLGAVHAAIAEAQRSPGVLEPADWDMLHGKRASQFVDWGTVAATDRKSSTPDGDVALALLDELLVTAKDPAVRARAASDRLVALRDRRRMSDVIRDYEGYAKSGPDPAQFKPQAWTAVADAYTYEGNPERAVALYRRALVQLRAQDGDRHRAVVGQYYALLRLEEYDEANELMEELAAEEPAWVSSYGGTPRENPSKLGADRHMIVMQAWSDRLREASSQLERHVTRAPYNADLRADLAAVYHWRGWSSRALDQARMALSVEPDHVGARIALTRAYLGRREFKDAEREVQTLTAAQPNNPLVRELRDEWDSRDLWELAGALGAGKSSNGDVFGDRDYSAEFHLYTRPIDYFTRVFVHGLSAAGELEEGTARVNRVGVGLEHERRLWNARGEIYNTWQHENSGIESSLGFDASLGLTPDDHWRLTGKFESDTLQQPMRGRLDSVEGKRYALAVDHWFSDLTQASLEVSHIDMSDDNERDIGVLSLSRRLITSSHYKLTVTPQIYVSQNSLDAAQAVYFNPKHDAEVSLEVMNEWLGSRRYDESFTHRLVATVAAYDQHDFEPAVTGRLRYEQELRLSKRTSYTYGIGVASYVFDGDREERVWVYLQPNWRF